VKTPTVIVVAIAFAMVALTGPTAASASPDPKSIVLPLNDMPTGFGLKDAKYYSAAAVVKEQDTTMAQLKSWGYVNGYQAEYDRDVSLGSMLNGPIEIDSYASVYKHDDGAKKSMQASLDSARKQHYPELSVGTRLGDDAHLFSYAKKSGSSTFQIYIVMWRHHAVKNTILTVGLKGAVSPQQAVNLAKAQDKRN